MTFIGLKRTSSGFSVNHEYKSGNQTSGQKTLGWGQGPNRRFLLFDCEACHPGQLSVPADHMSVVRVNERPGGSGLSWLRTCTDKPITDSSLSHTTESG